MNATVITNESSKTLVKPSVMNEVLFFAKSTAIMGAIILLVASAWV
ncbi:hypothetical protein V8073_004574 [Vibrio parahaemolyticus]|jgi:hypothetical protein|nr:MULTISPECIES: hypothetical protein [Vibrio]EIT7126898.1 hypothetical protein [Vibrio parahaemolyticus]MDE9381208.1 hypothetical protein [Vibrio alginolyticus]EIT7131884.1 hypothetical protein [Vibrio parahaemolyticus]EIZ1368746.1 hypothetical protein [Vibrio parahaemolyticus]EIZ4252333.1 hypothetical protein [Vibrio parahaemolyticus]|tara:strand:+ start:135 stop:272 length:138 start_codon:yes stop_codon:yes gene_type:complete